ncbi:hypothetical protein [Mycobacterium spongiae]|uniref:YCII-related domain-containing protein n=1 Tax=Mycobacterium spongiae TaxID=886343 RepID=A0A975K049_9MYCO|nr:hypothetical protein [Mycobacterium spongiae]QUR68926.1 hypothetical protein F6B93_19255 [Mycobacterium spongiae]
MPKYHLTYGGGAQMPETTREMEAMMQAWNSWFRDLGDALVDPGNAFGDRRRIDSAGAGLPATGATGYSILTADDLDAAVALAGTNPVLAAGGAVEISACLDM